MAKILTFKHILIFFLNVLKNPENSYLSPRKFESNPWKFESHQIGETAYCAWET